MDAVRPSHIGDGNRCWAMLGFDEAAGTALTEEAGFTSFRVTPVDHPVNVAYEVRP